MNRILTFKALLLESANPVIGLIGSFALYPYS